MPDKYSTSSCLIVIVACFIANIAALEAIVLGKDVTLNQFPYQVSVQNHRYDHICGGGVINRLFIVTAANCVVGPRLQFVRWHLYVVVSTIELNDTFPPADTIQIKRIHLSNDYNTTGYVADIALLELQYELTSFIRSNAYLRLPSRILHRDLNNTNGVIAGYGWNRVDPSGITGTSDGRLRFAQVNIFVKKACEQTYSPGTVNSKRHVCARMNVDHPRRVRHFGAGEGDEGAPLVLDYNRNPVVVGVLARRSPSCDEKDHRGYPGIYTRVSYYRKFISDVLKGKKRTTIFTYP